MIDGCHLKPCSRFSEFWQKTKKLTNKQKKKPFAQEHQIYEIHPMCAMFTRVIHLCKLPKAPLISRAKNSWIREKYDLYCQALHSITVEIEAKLVEIRHDDQIRIKVHDGKKNARIVTKESMARWLSFNVPLNGFFCQQNHNSFFHIL